MLSKDSDSNFF